MPKVKAKAPAIEPVDLFDELRKILRKAPSSRKKSALRKAIAKKK
jgi:hypothetical protein